MSEEAEKIIIEEELSDKIEKFIATEITPFVQQDGGHIEFLQFSLSTGVVRIQMLGACSNCPSASMTLHFGIERRLKEQFPEVTSVQVQQPPSLLDAVEE
jgi:Fe-S cluster biogenesis protein NfuA